MYIIREGRVKVTKLSEDGREKILEFLDAGSFVGEMALLERAPRSASVKTLAPVRLLALSRNDFLSLLRRSPDLGLAVIEVLCSRLRTQNDQASALSFQRVKDRTKGLLQRLAKSEHADGMRSTPTLTHQQIADMIGTSRETVTRVVKELKQDGWLDQEGKHYLLKNVESAAARRSPLSARRRVSDRPCVDLGADAFAASLLGSLNAGLVAIDADGRLCVLNEPARRILRLGEGGLLGRPCQEVFRGQPRVAELLFAALEGREAPSRAELALAGEPPRSIGFTLAPVRAETGALRGAALLFRDLQPLERVDERERLRERLVALGEMAAGLAHEIRNPLASLGVLAGLLRRRLPAEASEERGLVDELLAEVRALEATVTAALDFVKPTPVLPAAVDLVEALEAALAQARARIPFDGELERATRSRGRWCRATPSSSAACSPTSSPTPSRRCGRAPARGGSCCASSAARRSPTTACCASRRAGRCPVSGAARPWSR